MVFGNSSGGGGFRAGKQVFPVDYEVEVSQRLVEASLVNNLKLAFECIEDPSVDVNYVGAVSFKVRKTDVILREDLPNEVGVEYQEFRTDVTALFLAVHNGNVDLVRKLLSVGADVNHKLFRGFPSTGAAREANATILEILLKAGASQPACEESLIEASCHGHAGMAEQLMASDLIRPNVVVQALIIASSRGFVDVISVLLKFGVDVNASNRVLLQSCKPYLHANIECPALVAAVVSRQVSAVRLLLEAGARTDVKVQLGAWSWDTESGEEFRVGAGLAEPYPITWCAVEYFEVSGAILNMLLQRLPHSNFHLGRTLLHHAILCEKLCAVKMLLKSGHYNIEDPVKITKGNNFRPIHLASRLGFSAILQHLIEAGCNLNSKTEAGETAPMICAKYRTGESLKVLARTGADFGLLNFAGQSVSSIAVSYKWYFGFQQAVLDVIRDGMIPSSSNLSIFSPLMFVAQAGDVLALKVLIGSGDINIDAQDDRGFSAVMVTAEEGHVEAFRLLFYSGADIKLSNKSGETAIALSQLNQKRELFAKVILEFALENGNHKAGWLYALHFAARHGDLTAVKLLIGKGHDVNMLDGDGYTPLMLAAIEGYAHVCQLLISYGANCNMKNAEGETALSLARKTGRLENDVENVILDKLARELVLNGSNVLKHTKGGKGAPHMKLLKMMGSGVLHWGNSQSRNAICQEAKLGASLKFQRIRERKGDAYQPGLFRVTTTRNKEVHFVCNGGSEMAQLWVRGIKLLTPNSHL